MLRRARYSSLSRTAILGLLLWSGNAVVAETARQAQHSVQHGTIEKFAPIQNSEAPADDPTEGNADDLDKRFYNEYLDSLPNRYVQRKALLEQNLLDTARTMIPREDPFEGAEVARRLQAADLEYQRVTLESAFVRGLFAELNYLRETEFMYVVRAGGYLVFMSFRADPSRFTIDAYQTRVIKVRSEARDHQ